MLSEEEATEFAWAAVRKCGGTRSIYRNPRQAFSAQSRRLVDIDGTTVEIRYGEISTPPSPRSRVGSSKSTTRTSNC